MIKFNLILFLLILYSNLLGQVELNKGLNMKWNKPDYDSAVVYLYGVHNGYSKFIINDQNLSLDTSIVHSLTKKISKELSDSIITLLKMKPVNDSSELVNKKLCWKPHHGIVFYKNSLPTAALSICFLCEKYVGKPETPFRNTEIESLKEIIIDLGFPIFKNLEEAISYKE